MSATQEPMPDLAQRKLSAEIDKLQAEARLLKRPWLDPRGVLIPFLGAEVAVRGKVVKFSAGIMGRNWVHLHDGSGAQDKGNNDITVTTGDTAAVGDVVVARGVVRTDKDFGAGYAYPVIVEDAKLSN